MSGDVWFLILVLIFVFCLLPIWIAANVTASRGRGSAAGVLLGLFLGWLGVGIALLLGRPGQAGVSAGGDPRLYRECPHCKEPMRRDAGTCPHCHKSSPPWTLYEDNWFYRSQEGVWQLYRERFDEWLALEGESLEAAGTSAVALATMRANGRPHSQTALRDCPHCQEPMHRGEELCPHCEKTSPPWRLHEGEWWSKSEDGHWHFLDEKRNQWLLYEGEEARAVD